MENASEMTAEQQQKDYENQIIDEVMQKRESYPAAWKDIYEECKKHEEFVLMGKQMDVPTLRKYGFSTTARQPNLLKTYINNQANETLQTRYHPVISPNGGGSDITKARMREDVLRGISRNGFDYTVNAGRRGQLSGGIHYSRVVVDYFSTAGGFENEFRDEDVPDTYNTFPDPNVITPTFSDMRDFLIKEDVPKSLWKERTGTSWNFGQSKSRTLWYYWKKRSVNQDTQYLMKDGTEQLASQMGLDDAGQPDLSGIQMQDDGHTPYSRDVTQYEWEWWIVQDQSKTIMKSGKWLGFYSPLLACTGERVVENTGNGQKVHYYPMTRDAEEPQLMYTIVENIIKLRLGKSPYSKWKIAFESIIQKQSKEYRESAITGEFDVLYRSYTEDGKPIPAPEEMEPHILDRVLPELQNIQIQKIERILGIFDNSLGKQTQAKSGVAVRELSAQSNLSQFHYTFNFMEYIKQNGMVKLDAFPKYLTAPQQIAFVDRDDNAVMQMINTPGAPSFDPNERYSLVIEASSDSDTDREAEAAGLMDMLGNDYLGPVIAKIPGAMALVIKAQKGRYAQQLGEMMDKAANDPEKQAMQQQLQQQGQAIQQFKQKILESNLALKSKGDSASLETMKENNRHLEEITRLRLDAEVEPFNANTDRLKVLQVPQVTNELPVTEVG